MRHLSQAALLALALLLPAVPSIAKAGFIVEASLGKGLQVSPSIEQSFQQTNLLLAAGYGLGQVLRLEGGVVMDLPQTNRDLNLRFRPMLVIDPPILPVYGRLIAGFSNLLGSGPVAYEFGGAIGAGFSLMGVGVYAEIGLIPQAASGSQFAWLAEGRLGGYYAF